MEAYRGQLGEVSPIDACPNMIASKGEGGALDQIQLIVQVYRNRKTTVAGSLFVRRQRHLHFHA